VKIVQAQVEGAVRYAPIKSLWMSSMALAAVIGGAMTFSWACLLLFVTVTSMVLLFGATLGIHRKLIHDSFQCPRWLEYLMVYLGVQVGLCGPLGSVRQHALRDHAQNLPECHAYLCHGRPIWLDAWWQIHCTFELAAPAGWAPERRIAEDAFYRFLERTWVLQQAPLALLLYLWGGWGFVFWGVAARVTAAVGGYWLIAYLAHNHGAVRFPAGGAAVQSRNVRFTSLLTMGECWHNNHHAYPGSARLGLYAGEWDPGWWALSALRKCGLVWDLRVPAMASRQLPSA
jgi:stearoyl-CoA desaturase (delta-9 desaturase)